MQRRNFLSATLASVAAQTPAANPPVRIGVDVYSLQAQNWPPFQSLDFCSKLGVKVVHFSEIRFLGNPEASQGTAEEQLGRIIKAATILGSPIVRCVLGSAAERNGKIALEGHIENTIQVLKNIRSQATDANVKIAAENHAGDMQAREYERFPDLAEKGAAPGGSQALVVGEGRGGGRGRGPVSPEAQAQRLTTQREDLEVSIQYTKKLLRL